MNDSERIAAVEHVEPREGIVTAYDADGRYVGCIGAETWAGLLAGRGRWLSAAETEQVREALDGLWEFVVMVPCSDCGLPDPERYARNCVTCDRGAALIAVTRAALAVLAVPASQTARAEPEGGWSCRVRLTAASGDDVILGLLGDTPFEYDEYEMLLDLPGGRVSARVGDWLVRDARGLRVEKAVLAAELTEVELGADPDCLAPSEEVSAWIGYGHSGCPICGGEPATHWSRAQLDAYHEGRGQDG